MNLKNTSGFTIIEIVTVLALIGIITAFVIGRAGSDRVELVVQSEVLKTHLRYAQSRAMNSTLNFGIQSDISGSSYWLFKYDTSQAPPDVRVNLPSEQTDNVNLSAKGLSMTADAIISFDSRGIPYVDNAGTLQAADRTITISDGSNSLNITITKNTGFIP